MLTSVGPRSPGRVPLARDLGVTPMSSVHDVADKEQILDGIADLVSREIDLPSPGGD
jgi:hypothetical protein